MNSLLRALRAICNISSDDGVNFFAKELLCILGLGMPGKLEEWRSRQTESRKKNSRTALDGDFVK